MTKSGFIGLAAAATVSILLVGSSVVQAVQVSRPAAPAATSAGTAFQWSGGLGAARDGGPISATAPCPARKVWASLPQGPRLQWVRICAR